MMFFKSFYLAFLALSVSLSSRADGGTALLVAGTNFVHSAPNWLRCRFDTLSVIATFVTSTQVYCVSPSHDVGDVAVEVSNNNADYTADGVLFRYGTHESQTERRLCV